LPKDLGHRSDLHRRGSLCDRHCAALNNLHGDLADMHSESHQLLPLRIPSVVSSQGCCLHHSEEVQTCDRCLQKMMLTAENEVEAHRLSNNYKMKTPGPDCQTKFSKNHVVAEIEVVKDTTPLLPRQDSCKMGGCDYWWRCSTYVWLLAGFPLLVFAHVLLCVLCWLLVFFIPMAKMSLRTITTILLLPPECVHIQRLRKTEVPLDAEVVLCCYRAVSAYYYKYAVDGINVFAVSILLGPVGGQLWPSPVTSTSTSGETC
ncbi:hypothetical protein E2320_004399, partial [Naja naja]